MQNPVGKLLRRQGDTDGRIAQFMVAQLELAQALAQPDKIHVRAEIVGEAGEQLRREDGVAFNDKGFEGESRLISDATGSRLGSNSTGVFQKQE